MYKRQLLFIQSTTFIRDSYHYIAKTCDLNIITNSTLFSLDIVSLYTNIPIDGALKAIKEMFIRYPNSSRTDGVILKLLHIILNNNDFSFSNNVYVQNKGVAMGQRFAPSIANIYLH